MVGQTGDLTQYNISMSNKLSEICKPIFDNFGFSSFGYTRVFNDGCRLILETNKEWLEAYSKIDFRENNDGESSLIYNLHNLSSRPHLEEFYIQILTGAPKTELHKNLYTLGIWNSVSIYIHMNKFIEVYHLSTSKNDNSTIIDFCVNKKFLLARFFHYFREKISKLDLQKAPCIFDKALIGVFDKKLISNSIVNNEHITNYLKQTSIEKYYLKTHDKFISKREAECLHYLSAGNSSKEIARILKLSPRTVESYINSVKVKTNAYSKHDLSMIAHQNHINSSGLFFHAGG